MVAMPDEVLDESSLVAFWQSVAADPALLNMGSGDGQDVAVPFARGKSHPGVCRIGRRVVAAIHPDDAILFISADVLLYGDDVLGLGIFFDPDSQLQWPAIDVGS